MPTQFANTLNNHPIYADRAEKDAAGNTIATTYQEKLTAGTGITIDSSNVISATGGGGGSTYTAGNGIDISSDVISVQVTSPNAGDIVTLDCDGHLVDSGVAPSDLQPKLTAGANITIDANNVISASGGGGGTSYTAGDGISISGTTISAKIDNSTITTNASGQLVANGGGGGGSGVYTGTATIVGDLNQDQHLFTIDGISFDYRHDTTGGSLKRYISMSSSTVSTAIIDKDVTKYAANSGGYGYIWHFSSKAPVEQYVFPYAGVDISSAYRIIDIDEFDGISDVGVLYANSTGYPASLRFHIYYDVGNTHKVIYLNVIIWSKDFNGGLDIRYSYTIG